MDWDDLTVILIVALVIVGSVIRAAIRGPRHPVAWKHPEGEAENKRLRDEVGQLKERIKVLERITIEKENSVAREIESLRDR